MILLGTAVMREAVFALLNILKAEPQLSFPLKVNGQLGRVALPAPYLGYPRRSLEELSPNRACAFRYAPSSPVVQGSQIGHVHKIKTPIWDL